MLLGKASCVNGGEPGSAGLASGPCEDAPVPSGPWAWRAVGAWQILAVSQALSCSEPFLLLLFLLTPETSLSQDLLVPFKLFYVLIILCNFSHIKQHLHNIYIIVLNFVHAHTHIYGWPKSQVFLNTLWKILNKLFGPPKKTHTYMCVSCNLLCNYSFCPISLERAMPNYTITEIPESSRKPGKQMPNQYLSNHYVNKGHSPLLFLHYDFRSFKAPLTSKK